MSKVDQLQTLQYQIDRLREENQRLGELVKRKMPWCDTAGFYNGDMFYDWFRREVGVYAINITRDGKTVEQIDITPDVFNRLTKGEPK